MVHSRVPGSYDLQGWATGQQQASSPPASRVIRLGMARTAALGPMQVLSLKRARPPAGLLPAGRQQGRREHRCQASAAAVHAAASPGCALIVNEAPQAAVRAPQHAVHALLWGRERNGVQESAGQEVATHAC